MSSFNSVLNDNVWKQIKMIAFVVRQETYMELQMFCEAMKAHNLVHN